ncbi:MAG: hypothetical protein OJF51_003630 [Nitrospira sp.]|jgi:hypothetical protein|nr:MAG: hypothetical protein OJF51_003630 [Nitrospira sp.]
MQLDSSFSDQFKTEHNRMPLSTEAKAGTDFDYIQTRIVATHPGAITGHTVNPKFP